MRSISPVRRALLAGIGICWLCVDFLLVRIATNGTFSNLHYFQSLDVPLSAAFVVLVIVALYLAGRLLLAPDASTIRTSAALGLLAAFAGAGLRSVGHDSGLIISALAAGGGLASVSALRLR